MAEKPRPLIGRVLANDLDVCLEQYCQRDDSFLSLHGIERTEAPNIDSQEALAAASHALRSMVV